MNSLLPAWLKLDHSNYDIQIAGACSWRISHVEQCALGGVALAKFLAWLGGPVFRLFFHHRLALAQPWPRHPALILVSWLRFAM